MKKRIVFLDQYGSLGGGQQVLLELVHAAIACGHKASVLIPVGPCTQKLQALGAVVLSIPECALSQGKKSWKDCARLLWYCLYVFFLRFQRLREADIIYVNGNRLLPVALLAQYVLKKNAVFHIHLNHGPLERKVFLWALRSRRTKAIVVPSTFILHELQAFDTRFCDARVLLVENGLDARFSDIDFVDRFTDKRIEHIAIVGRISPEKGHDVVLALAPQFPDLQFHILGDAAFSDDAFAKNLQKNAPENVIFHGWIDDVPRKINDLGVQVCLVPSRVEEAFGLVPIEMTALSCLVLVRKKGALRHLAETLLLESFTSDIDLGAILCKFCEAYPQELSERVHISFQKTMQNYAHEAFVARLRTFFAKIDNILNTSSL